MALAHFPLEDDSSNSLARKRLFRDQLNPLDAYEINLGHITELRNVCSSFLKKSF